MRLEHNSTGMIEIVLSRRNLQALLNKLDFEDSQRTLVKSEASKSAGLMGGKGYVQVIVRAEENEEHYHHENRAEKERGLAGDVHPDHLPAPPEPCHSTDPRGTCLLPFGHGGDCVMTYMGGV